MTEPGKQLPRAVRLTIEYDKNSIRVVGRQNVDMLVPPSDPTQPSMRTSGFWYEVKDAQDSSLYRRTMPNPIGRDIEVYDVDPARSMHRTADDRSSGVFTILVPYLEKGVALTLSSTEGHGGRRPTGPGAFTEKHGDVEVARFNLMEEP